MRNNSDKLVAIIKEALYRATKRDIILTPFNYYKIFVEVALEYGLKESELHRFLYGSGEVSSEELEQLKRRVLDIASNIKDITDDVKEKLEKSAVQYDDSIKSISNYAGMVDEGIANELEKVKYINYSLKSELEAARKVLEKQRKSIENIKEMSLKDHLTGLYLRRYMNDVLENLIYSYNRYKKVFSVIMMDLDNFKSINDTYGHLAGDEVLRVIGSVLKTSTRKSDIPIRYGGDEFIVILPETKLDDAVVVARKIKDKINSIKFKKNNIEFKCSLSLGVTQVKDGDTVESVLDRVDQALYKTKKNEKGEITVLE